MSFNPENEAKLEAAKQAIAERPGLSIKRAAEEFGVHHKTLGRRLKGPRLPKRQGGQNRTLNDEQTKAIYAFLDRQISNGVDTTKEVVVAAAQRLLDVAGKNKQIPAWWYEKWIRKHPQYYVPQRHGPAPKTLDHFDHLENLIKSQTIVEKPILDALVELGTPIVSVAILDRGDITSKVLGSPIRDPNSRGSSKPFDNDTLFQACSISKPITALSVIKLCQDGKLNLDTPISQYLTPEQLSWISTPQTHPLVSQITLRLLLSHTSGLSLQGYSGYSTIQLPTLPQIIAGLPPANNEPIRLSFVPGQKFSYSGGGFTVIQLILENHFQKPFHILMDEEIFRPLKMTRSTYQILPAVEKNYAPAYLTGKLKADPDHHLQPESTAAGLWTTPTDLMKGVQAVQWGLESEGYHDFLQKQWTEIMLAEIEENGMALGWVAKRNGMSFDHGGSNDPGYRCYFVGYADLACSDSTASGDDDVENNERRRLSVPKDCGFCIMTSSALGEIVWAKLMTAIPYLKGWPSPFKEKWPWRVQTHVPFMDRKKKIDEEAEEWCGQWGSGSWTLVNGNGFFVRYANLVPIQLFAAAIPPHTYDEGESIDLVADGLEMMLRLGWDDGVRILEIWQNGEIQTLSRNQDGCRSVSTLSY